MLQRTLCRSVRSGLLLGGKQVQTTATRLGRMFSVSASHSDKYTFGSYSSNPKDSPSYPEGCLSAESLTKIIQDATKKLPKEETAKYETILQEINDRIAEYDNMRTEKNYHLLLDVLIRNHFFLQVDELVRRATNLDKF